VDHTPYAQEELPYRVPKHVWDRAKELSYKLHAFDLESEMDAEDWYQWGFMWAWDCVRRAYADYLLEVCTESLVQLMRGQLQYAVLFDSLFKSGNDTLFPLDMDVGLELANYVWCELKDLPK